MLRHDLTGLALLAAVTLFPAAALAGDATTTRIETRPFYGATVTLEEGVRVFRPLPPHSNVIINPHGATPLSLGIEQSSVTHNHNGAGSGAAGRDHDHLVPGGGFYSGAGRRAGDHHGRHDHRVGHGFPRSHHSGPGKH